MYLFLHLHSIWKCFEIQNFCHSQDLEFSFFFLKNFSKSSIFLYVIFLFFYIYSKNIHTYIRIIIYLACVYRNLFQRPFHHPFSKGSNSLKDIFKETKKKNNTFYFRNLKRVKKQNEKERKKKKKKFFISTKIEKRFFFFSFTKPSMRFILLNDWLILFILFAMLDGPAVVRVNIFVRSISKIDDVTMVS